jgi:hypothetical protein
MKNRHDRNPNRSLAFLWIALFLLVIPACQPETGTEGADRTGEHEEDRLWEGTHSPGSLYGSFTVSSTVTTLR